MKSFFVGIGLGFGVGLLLAPAAGSETRKKVMERLTPLADQLHESSEPIVSAVRESVESLTDTANEPHQPDSIGEGQAEEASRLLVILNSASKTKLMSVSGIGDATARRIIESRPYNSADRLIEDGILSEVIMTTLKKTLLVDDEAA
ncbi:MAG TPA: YtxH domain-containing protein [Terriglobales bacterium]|jgi:DNA uptake protein ComE-like DNA-binding protein|nr:YtxH domain-containing protein [Terriglobales bacterium]